MARTFRVKRRWSEAETAELYALARGHRQRIPNGLLIRLARDMKRSPRAVAARLYVMRKVIEIEDAPGPVLTPYGRLITRLRAEHEAAHGR